MGEVINSNPISKGLLTTIKMLMSLTAPLILLSIGAGLSLSKSGISFAAKVTALRMPLVLIISYVIGKLILRNLLGLPFAYEAALVRKIDVFSRYGGLFEAMIMQEVIRINDYYQLDLKCSYWQTGNGHKVDLILSRGLGQPLAAIEIKSSKTVNTKKLKGLYSFKEDYPDVPVYCFCQTPYPFTEDNISFLPWREGLKKLTEI